VGNGRELLVHLVDNHGGEKFEGLEQVNTRQKMRGRLESDLDQGGPVGQKVGPVENGIGGLGEGRTGTQGKWLENPSCPNKKSSLGEGQRICQRLKG